MLIPTHEMNAIPIATRRNFRDDMNVLVVGTDMDAYLTHTYTRTGSNLFEDGTAHVHAHIHIMPLKNNIRRTLN